VHDETYSGAKAMLLLDTMKLPPFPPQPCIYIQVRMRTQDQQDLQARRRAWRSFWRLVLASAGNTPANCPRPTVLSGPVGIWTNEAAKGHAIGSLFHSSSISYTYIHIYEADSHTTTQPRHLAQDGGPPAALTRGTYRRHTRSRLATSRAAAPW